MMESKKLQEILELHKKYLQGEAAGVRADLSDADLRGVDLGGADLSDADLRFADLRDADLRWVNLSMADLSCANLRGAQGEFVTCYCKYPAIAAGGYISIGCKRCTYQYWLDHYAEIGKKYKYTESEIERYGDWIKLAVERLGAE